VNTKHFLSVVASVTYSQHWALNGYAFIFYTFAISLKFRENAALFKFLKIQIIKIISCVFSFINK